MGLLFFIALGQDIAAQVTIGSNQAPAAGALLDLKQEDVTNKGLGLPRVILRSLIIPEGGDNLSSTIAIDEATGAWDETSHWDKTSHAGLLVYHAGKYDACDSRSIRQGVYVWDGDQWQYIGSGDNKSDLVQTIEDQRDGEVYLYRNFNTAGDWMLQNMRYKEGLMQGFGDGSVEGKYYVYPNTDENSPNVVPDSWRPEQGLLYTYSAATLGEQGVSGVCPEGWHIPTDEEWSLLEKEIYNNPMGYSEYTSYFNPPKWLDEWDNEAVFVRGASEVDGHGAAMLSTCLPVGTIFEKEISPSRLKGRSYSAVKGGFDALPVGISGISYGNITVFWSSSLSDEFEENTSWGRIIYAYEPETPEEIMKATVTRSPMEHTQFFSVRCKRN